MARALDKHVYCGVGLRSAGASATKTRILVVEVHARGGQEKRVNLAESDAVVEIVRKLLTSNGAQDIAVVTPYKNQIKTIRKALRACNNLSEIDALNTHQTQGREWDTVIFSAVDGTLPRCRPYFTNSKIPVGKAVLNTTLSRVKSQLILVVEKEFWRQKEGQLLCDLVGLAEPFNGDWAVDL
jgi:superfamily I DNA and/or RNA helicase